ncbi:MAG: hypothetical protein ACYTDT_05750 [Planctomycetota bacterium]|jgi:hypothetical protein
MNDETIIAYLLGELESPEARELFEAQLREIPDMEQRVEDMRRSINALRLIPRDDVKDGVVVALLKRARAETSAQDAPIIKLPTFASRLAAAAAAIAIAGLIGFGVMFMPEPNERMLATVESVALHDGDVIESGIGETREISFDGGSVLLDGASAVQVFDQGKFKPPHIEVKHGRAIVTSDGDAAVIVTAWQRRLDVQSGATAAISFDTPFAHVNDEQFEVRSQKIGAVIALAEQQGVRVDVSSLRDDVRQTLLNRRVTFFGRNTGKETLVRTLQHSVAKFGIENHIERDVLTLTGSGHGSREGIYTSELQVAVLEGEVLIKGTDGANSLSKAGSNFYAVRESANVEESPVIERRSERGYREMVVWAGLAEESEIEQSRLPAGSVIHPDRLVVFDDGSERIFKLGGADYKFPLPGGNNGRVIGLMSSGAEFEYQEGDDVKRVFIPFSKLKQR